MGAAARAGGACHGGLLRGGLDDVAAGPRLCRPPILVGACVFGSGRDNPSKRSEVATGTANVEASRRAGREPWRGELSIEPRIKVGTVAFVTGASSGIGRAIATALVREGCRIVLAGRNQEALRSLASILGEEANPLVLDVTIGLSVDKIPDCLPEKFRDIGILV